MLTCRHRINQQFKGTSARTMTAILNAHIITGIIEGEVVNKQTVFVSFRFALVFPVPLKQQIIGAVTYDCWKTGVVSP